MEGQHAAARRAPGRRGATTVVLGLALGLLSLPAPILLGVPPAFAAEGDVLFVDDFESGLARWTTSDETLSGVNGMTAGSGSRSLYVRGEPVSTTSEPIDTRVPAIRIQAWVRRGSRSFSEDPDRGEDLMIEGLDASGGWIPLASLPGSGRPGEVQDVDTTVSGQALHAGFRIRVRLVSGSGGPPRNRGRGWDYWHVDDVTISEAAPARPLGLASCEAFDSGLGAWQVFSDGGRAGVGDHTASSPPSSLALSEERVSVLSPVTDLTNASDLGLTLWIRRGSDRFSERPDRREDLVLEYLADSGRWIELDRWSGNGAPGEIIEPSWNLPSDAAHSRFRIRLTLTDGSGRGFDFWHVDDVCLSGTAQTAEWRFDEPGWRGQPGEVVDSSGNGHDGVAIGGATTAFSSPAIEGDPGTCGYVDLDGRSQSVEIPHSDSLDGTDALTYSAWIQPRRWSGTRQVMAKSVHGGGSGRAQMGLFSENGRLVGRAETEAGRYEVFAPLPPTERWSHLALTFSGVRMTLYVNGAPADTLAFPATTLIRNGDPLSVGQRVGSEQYFFDGRIDEVRVQTRALSEAAIGEAMKSVHECPDQAVVFSIGHDGSGISCEPEPLTVTTFDFSGNRVRGYAGTIVLDTQSGRGTWSLLAGAGRFGDSGNDSGIARYEFAARDEGFATFALSYSDGPPVLDVDVFDGVSRDDDSEGELIFGPDTFLITPKPLPSSPSRASRGAGSTGDPIGTQLAGRAFELHLTAYGSSISSGPSCGLVDSYTGPKKLRFWVDHQDPVRAPLVPTIEGRRIAASEDVADAQNVRFEQGRAVVVAHYKDVGRLAIGVLDDTVPKAPIRGSTGGFVSRPADLRVTQVESSAGEPNPAVGTPDGPVFARAGEAFRVRVEARDAEGSRTPSFGRESRPERIRIESSALVAPAGGRNGIADDGSLANATDFVAIAPAGTFEGSTFAFDEVGAIRLRARVADDDYLGTGPLLGTASGTVGRFAPSRFEIAVNTPRLGTACAIGAFTWLGQPFGYVPGEEPVITVTAVNAAGGRTANYAGDWWRLTNASLGLRRYAANGVPVDTSRLPDPSADPVIVPNGDGTGELTFSAGSGLVLERTNPVAPFDAEIELAVDVRDLDDTAYPLNPATIGGTAVGAGIDFDVSNRFQLGRVRVDNAFGSDLVALPMSLRTQRFDGTAFVDEDADSCTRIPVAALDLSPAPTGLSTDATIENTPLLSGEAGLVLSAPGDEGAVDVVVDLGATGADVPWLRFDWPEDGNLDGRLDDDPRARATFGIWEGREPLIYLREMY